MNVFCRGAQVSNKLQLINQFCSHAYKPLQEQWSSKMAQSTCNRSMSYLRFNWTQRRSSFARQAARHVWVAHSCGQLGGRLWYRIFFHIITQCDDIYGISFFFNLLRLISSGRIWRLEDVIARLNEKYGTQLLVNFFVGTDDRDSNSHIIHVSAQL